MYGPGLGYAPDVAGVAEPGLQDHGRTPGAAALQVQAASAHLDRAGDIILAFGGRAGRYDESQGEAGGEQRGRRT